MDYNPDKWLIVKITGKDYPTVYKVFACWYGGYLGSDSWKLNSGITKVSEVREYFFFEGSSGSIYSCRKGCYGANGYGSSVLSGLIEKVEKNGGTMEILPEETNWLEVDYA